jgi:hypothetical protein
MKPYTMKDLGYKRTPTTAKLRVEMPDGTLWDVPVQVIADSRDEHYADEEEDTIGGIRDGGLTDYEIKDWAAGNMNWDEVKRYAVQAPTRAFSVDFQEGWINGDKEIVGEI